MSDWVHQHSDWFMLAIVAIVFTIALTAYVLWHNRYVERGPQKGAAADPGRVRRQNPPDEGRA